MAWMRRRSKWPVLVLLCLLFAATLVAPWAWTRLRAEREWREIVTGSLASRETPSLPAAGRRPFESEPELRLPGVLTPPGSVEPAPELPPLARPATPQAKRRKPASAIATLGDIAPQDLSIAEPSLTAAQTGPAVSAESALAVDDYVVVDEPLPAKAPPVESSILAESTATIELVEPQPTIIPHLAPAAPHSAVPLVRVESSDERLAMLPMISQAITNLLPSPQQLSSPQSFGPVLKHAPLALEKQLASLAAMPPADEWAGEVTQRIDALTAPTTPAGLVPGGVVAELRTLAIRGLNDGTQVADPATQSAWLRASRALERRLTLWELLADPRLKHEAESFARSTVSASTDLTAVLHQISATISAAPAGPTWRQYLELDEIASLSSRWGPTSTQACGARSRGRCSLGSTARGSRPSSARSSRSR